MDAYELMDRVGGEIVRSQIRYRDEAGVVVIAKLNGDSMELTAAGRDMVRLMEATPAKRRGKPKAKPAPEPESPPADDFLAGLTGSSD